MMRVAVYQCAGGGLNLDERLLRLQDFVNSEQQASTHKIDLVVCPELFSSGYNIGDDIVACADAAQGKVFERFAELAQSLKTALLYGYPEKSGNNIYNAAACVSASGELLANHRKQLNSPGSFEEDYFTPGERCTLLEYGGLKIGILICYEVELPEAVRAAAANGAQLVLAPTALIDQWDVVASRVVPARAFENGIWLAYANHAGHENGFDYLGGSKIVAPDGSIQVDAGPDEGIICADIDVDSVTRAQQRLPYLRDYTRYRSS